MAKSDTKKQKSPEIEIVWNGDVPNSCTEPEGAVPRGIVAMERFYRIAAAR